MWTFSSTSYSRKTSLQTRTTYSVEDIQYIPHVIADARYYKKKHVDQANQTLSELKKFEAKDNKEYKVKVIINNAVYG